MLSNKNTVLIASAGSRKTTYLVEEALKVAGKRVLLTTYTNENVDQINSYIVERNGCVPSNVTVLSWYSFLLQDGVRPYQNHITARTRINTINFAATPPRFAKKTEDDYYLTPGNNIYRDRVAAFVCECDDRSNGLVLKRLEKIYARMFIDELQDLAGPDLDFLQKLFCSSLSVVAVGDPRQATYSTNNALKNKKFRKSHITEWIAEKRRAGLISVQERNECYRSNQAICDFGDSLFPHLPKTKSMNTETTGHDGIFEIKDHEALEYFEKFRPVVLRHNRRTNTKNLPALNIGVTKGRTYERVLIFPTHPMKDYLQTKDISKAGDLAKLYVAVTRAKHSACFVVD